MKWLIVLFGCIFLLFGGCQEFSHNKSGIDVIIEGGGEFPSFLVGKWVDKEQGWEFVFERDGTISFVVMGQTGPYQEKIRPGQVTTVNTASGKGVYEPGDWTVGYAPTRRELTVMISLKNFYIDLEDGRLEGDCVDVFAGPISQDGNEWRAEWTSFPHFILRTPQNPHLELTKDLVDENGIESTLFFEKIEPK